MTPNLSFSNRYVRLGLVAVVLLFLVFLVLAPATGQKTSGSTYNRAPEGYLGWYQYMTDQGRPVQRWQRPLADLVAQAPDTPQTLLRIYPGLEYGRRLEMQSWATDWLAAGNTLVVLGIEQQVTEAPFTTRQASPQGEVVIKTRRRTSPLREPDNQRLGDEYGAIVWREPWPDTDGTVIFAVTPHLAANAYQNEPGNYAFLAELVSQTNGPIWVDEYLHGYREADVIETEEVTSWGEYLAGTPLKVAVIQLAIVLGLFLLSQNRRLGNLTPLKPPKIDNSQVYIEALAAVLHKADSTAFVVQMITRAERLLLQRTLGFNDTSVDDAQLQTAWTQQTGQSEQRLTPLLHPPNPGGKHPDQRLTQWLVKLKQIRQTPIR